MITKVQRPPRLAVNAMSLAKIYAEDKAFFGSCLAVDFWVQTDGDKITAVVSSCGGSMNIYTDGADFSELSAFVRALSPAVIFTEYENAAPLSLKCDRVRNMLRFKSEKTADTTADFTLWGLYDGLALGSDVDIHLPTFEVFAPDVSHRLRHGGAVAVLKKEGAALAFLYEGGGVMTGIALSPASRGKGLGKVLLGELLSHVDGDFFVAANDTNKEFYLRCGFTLSGKVCFGRLE